tara:strand:- start:140 stop:292 length:153 start_codon:yes stop_codon:yes gene_type:complete
MLYIFLSCSLSFSLFLSLSLRERMLVVVDDVMMMMMRWSLFSVVVDRESY